MIYSFRQHFFHFSRVAAAASWVKQRILLFRSSILCNFFCFFASCGSRKSRAKAHLRQFRDSSIASRKNTDLQLPQVEKNGKQIPQDLVVTMWRAAARVPFAAARPIAFHTHQNTNHVSNADSKEPGGRGIDGERGFHNTGGRGGAMSDVTQQAKSHKLTR